MRVQLVEVEEIIIHMVTVLADGEHEAIEKALVFDCVESETLSPQYRCLYVRPLGDD